MLHYPSHCRIRLAMIRHSSNSIPLQSRTHPFKTNKESSFQAFQHTRLLQSIAHPPHHTLYHHIPPSSYAHHPIPTIQSSDHTSRNQRERSPNAKAMASASAWDSGFEAQRHLMSTVTVEDFSESFARRQMIPPEGLTEVD